VGGGYGGIGLAQALESDYNALVLGVLCDDYDSVLLFCSVRRVL